jgi:glucose-1-phosphate thymidylyltransferase
MKALVLAGGNGLRLRPISHTLPKQLAPVANKPVLHYGLEALAAVGITEVGVVVGGRAAEIRRGVGDGAPFGLRVTYLPQEEPLGLAHCVLIARDFLGDEDFLMYLGDNVVPGGVPALTERFRAAGPDAMLLLGAVPNPTDFGVAEVDVAGRVLALEEKSPTPRSDLAMIGVYAFTAAIHRAVREIEPSWRSELEITQAIQWLVENGGNVRAHVFDGPWWDTGRVENLLDCNRQMLLGLGSDVRGKVDAETDIAGPVVLGEGAQVLRSRIVGPVAIGSNTVIADSYVGPFTSIGDECVLSGAGIEYSIVLERSSICSVRHIRDSLIGRGSQVSPSQGVGGAHQLILGDDSRVLLEAHA